jgi:hypothetical protein
MVQVYEYSYMCTHCICMYSNTPWQIYIRRGRVHVYSEYRVHVYYMLLVVFYSRRALVSV